MHPITSPRRPYAPTAARPVTLFGLAGLAIAICTAALPASVNHAMLEPEVDAASEPPADLLAGPHVTITGNTAGTLVERRFDGTLVRLERFAELEAIDRMTLSDRTQAELKRAMDERAVVIQGIVTNDYRRVDALTKTLQSMNEARTQNGGPRWMQSAPDATTRAVYDELRAILKPLTDRGTLEQEIVRVLSEIEQAQFQTMVLEYQAAERQEMARQRRGAAMTDDMMTTDDAARPARLGRQGRADRPGGEGMSGAAGTGNEPMLDFDAPFDAPERGQRRTREQDRPGADAPGARPERRAQSDAYARMNQLVELRGYVREVMTAFRDTIDITREQTAESLAGLGLSPEQEAQLRDLLRSRNNNADAVTPEAPTPDRAANRRALQEFTQGLDETQRAKLREFIANRRGNRIGK